MDNPDNARKLLKQHPFKQILIEGISRFGRLLPLPSQLSTIPLPFINQLPSSLQSPILLYGSTARLGPSGTCNLQSPATCCWVATPTLWSWTAAVISLPWSMSHCTRLWSAEEPGLQLPGSQGLAPCFMSGKVSGITIDFTWKAPRKVQG